MTTPSNPLHEVAVLFTHHADNAATRNNLAVLRHHNPGVPVIPMSQWGVTLKDGYNASQMTAGWRRLLPSFRTSRGIKGMIDRWRQKFEPRWIWRNADLSAYMWILWPSRPVQAKRWVIFEWDMYCNVRLADFYAGTWDAPVVSTFQQFPDKNPDFYYFNDAEKQRLPESLKPHLMATNPWAGMMFSDAALKGIANRVRELRFRNGFCELRVGTVARSLGFMPVPNANPLASRTLRSVPEFEVREMDVASVWHKVKRHDPLTLTPPMQ